MNTITENKQSRACCHEYQTIPDAYTGSRDMNIKILFVIENFEIGGTQKVMVNLASELHCRGYGVAFAALQDKGTLQTQLNGIYVTSLKPQKTLPALIRHTSTDAGIIRWAHIKRVRKVVAYSTPLAETINKLQPEIIFSAGMFGNCVVAEAIPQTRTKQAKSLMCLSGHVIRQASSIADTAAGAGGHNPSKVTYPSMTWPTSYIRRCFSRADSVVSVSKGLENEARALKLTNRNLRTIYNPVITDDVRRLSSIPPSHPWLVQKTDPVIISVGRFSEEKDYLFLLKAFAEANSKRNIRLILIGYNPESGQQLRYRKRLESFATALGITDRVHMLPATDNPYSYMSRADLFALSSPAEGFGNTLVEALHCGLRIVSTDCRSGPREILENGKYGILTPVGDATAMADALIHALDTHPDKLALRRRAETFSLEQSASEYQTLIQEML